jgi:hypothetical protein
MAEADEMTDSKKTNEDDAERGKVKSETASEKPEPKTRKTSKEEKVKKDTGKRAPDAESMKNKLFAIIVVIAVIGVSFYAIILYQQGADEDNGGGEGGNKLPIVEAGDDIEIMTLEPHQFTGTTNNRSDGINSFPAGSVQRNCRGPGRIHFVIRMGF